MINVEVVTPTLEEALDDAYSAFAQLTPDQQQAFWDAEIGPKTRALVKYGGVEAAMHLAELHPEAVEAIEALRLA